MFLFVVLRFAAAAAACTYQGRSEATYCSFYGDPHLTTFGGEFQTCKVAGAWPLIDNAYLAVSVTNEAVVPGSAATATTKVYFFGASVFVFQNIFVVVDQSVAAFLPMATASSDPPPRRRTLYAVAAAAAAAAPRGGSVSVAVATESVRVARLNGRPRRK